MFGHAAMATRSSLDPLRMPVNEVMGQRSRSCGTYFNWTSQRPNLHFRRGLCLKVRVEC